MQHRLRRQREADLDTLSRLRYDFLDKCLRYSACCDEESKQDFLAEMDFLLDLYRDIEARVMVAGLAEALG